MSLKISISGAQRLGPGAWQVKIRPEDVRRLGGANSQRGERSVVAVFGEEPAFRVGGELALSPSELVVLNVGSTDAAWVLHLGQSVNEQGEVAMPVHAISDAVMGKSDTEFIASCRAHEMPDDLVEGMERLLKRVRTEFSGALREGQNRKWVNYPDNFVAITIQHRDRSFAVHVKGRPDQFLKGSLVLKDDRPGYSRFKLARAVDVKEATDVVLRSARSSARR